MTSSQEQHPERFESSGVFNRRSLLKGGLATGAMMGLAACGSTSSASSSGASSSSLPASVAGLYVSAGILTTASYWEGPKLALKKAQQAYPGVKTQFTGVTTDNDSDLITVLSELLPKSPKGLMIEPADPRTVQSFIKTAHAQGVPCLTVNSAYLANGQELGYIGFSRQEQGQLVAQEMAKYLSKKGGIVVGIVFDASAVAMIDVYSGFKSEMASLRPDLQVMEAVDKADLQYGTTLVTELLNSHNNIVGLAGLDTVAGQIAANAVKATGRTDVVVIAGALDEAQSQYWPLVESGAVKSAVLSSSFEQFWVAMQFLVNLQSRAIDGIDWQSYKDVRVVPKQVDLGSYVIDKSNIGAVKNLKLA